MRLRISSRKSDLARLQAYRVAEALKKAHPHAEITFHFKESLGDINLIDPLWKIPEKGVFTEDFQQELLNDEADMIVHSWKDLPTEIKTETEIVATLPRADQRDLLLLKTAEMDRLSSSGGRLQIFSSSPRRAYNLEAFLQSALPLGGQTKIEFESVRGNIPTRLRKLIQSTEAQGLVLAKAALDRLLTAPEPEFTEVQKEICLMLKQCRWIVLPLSVNPNAAAQGALAVEILKSRKDLKKVLSAINDEKTFSAAQSERDFLAGFGGGCHQKIGIAVLPRKDGVVQISQGKTDSGQKLGQFEFVSPRISDKRFTPDEMWAASSKDFFERKPLPFIGVPQSTDAVYVAKAEAWPADFHFAGTVWVSGVATWRKLASQGVWVNGCSDGLGEDEDLDLQPLTGKTHLNWVKLTHDRGYESGDKKVIATYQLVDNKKVQNLSHKKCFYWPSGSLFLKALEFNPELADRHHACGPGHTYKIIQQRLESMGKHSRGKREDNLEVFLTQEEWMRKCQISKA
jgi:hydroxymethylbilane synthase